MGKAHSLPMGKAQDPLGVLYVPQAHVGTLSQWAPTLIPFSFHMMGAQKAAEGSTGGMLGCTLPRLSSPHSIAHPCPAVT